MRKIMSIVLASAMVAGLAGCGAAETANVAEPEVENETVVMEDTKSVAEAETEDVVTTEEIVEEAVDTDSNGKPYTTEFNPLTNQTVEYYEITFLIPGTWEEINSSSGLVYNSSEGTLSITSGEISTSPSDMTSKTTQDSIISSVDSGDSFIETGRKTMTVLGDTTALYFTCSQNISGTPVDMYVLAFSSSDRNYMFGYADRQDSEYNHSKDFDEIIDSLSWAPGYGEEEETVSVPEDDFFGDEGRQEQYDELYKSYQFSALYDYVNEYIVETGADISTDDSAYKILDLVEPLLQYEGTWTVKQDELDSSYSLVFPGAEEISESESIKVSVSGSELRQTIGFRKNGWLFFDRYELGLDGESVKSGSVKSTSRDEEVISGNTIEESYTASNLFDDDVCDRAKDAETAIIRFSTSKSDETYEHTLTDAEKQALYVSNLVRDNWTDLSNLISRYRNNIVMD